MNCGQFETRMNLVLDQRRSPADDPALAAHAAVCTACEQLLADHSVLVACVVENRTPLLPSRGFANRVVAAAEVSTNMTAVRQRRASRLWLTLGVTLSSAAAMLLAISIVWQARRATVGGDVALAERDEFTTADMLIEAPRFPGNLVALAVPRGAAFRYEEFERVAPGIRPLRESLAFLWDALVGALPRSRDANRPPPAEQRTGRWWAESFTLA
jgi:hypothetical protein